MVSGRRGAIPLAETSETTRYDAVLLDVDGTLLWVDLDVDGYVEDLSPYAEGNGGLTREGPSGRCGGASGGTSGGT